MRACSIIALLLALTSIIEAKKKVVKKTSVNAYLNVGDGKSSKSASSFGNTDSAPLVAGLDNASVGSAASKEEGGDGDGIEDDYGGDDDGGDGGKSAVSAAQEGSLSDNLPEVPKSGSAARKAPAADIPTNIYEVQEEDRRHAEQLGAGEDVDSQMVGGNREFLKRQRRERRHKRTSRQYLEKMHQLALEHAALEVKKRRAAQK